MALIPTDYIDFAHQLADAAADAIRPYYRQALSVDIKDDKSPVTQADLAAEKAMREMIGATYPEHGIYGEEEGTSNLDAQWVWTLDPIDGTRSFIAGKPQFTTLISLCHNGEPVLGIIDQCILQERWLGIQGQQTTFNGEPCHTRDCETLGDALIATTSAEYFHMTKFHTYLDLRTQCRDAIYGGDGYNYALMASGYIDLIVESGLKPYDFCALVPIVQGAGGAACDWQKNKLNIHSAGDVYFTGKSILLEQIK